MRGRLALILMGGAVLCCRGRPGVRSSPGDAEATDAPAPASSLDAFLGHPGGNTWAALEQDLEGHKYGETLYAVWQFYKGVLGQLLPNSHAHVGISPDDHVEAMRRYAMAALPSIRAGLTPRIWRVVEAMAFCGKDEDPVVTAAGLELAARLSPTRFEQLAAEAVRRNVSSADMVERARQVTNGGRSP